MNDLIAALLVIGTVPALCGLLYGLSMSGGSGRRRHHPSLDGNSHQDYCWANCRVSAHGPGCSCTCIMDEIGVQGWLKRQQASALEEVPDAK